MVFKALVLASLVLNAVAVSTPRAADPLATVALAAPDGSIKANFMAWGATTTNLWVKDKNGKFRDVLLGWDNHTLYQTQADGHPYFAPVVGRYANRIRNGTFTIPISKDASGPGKKFQIVENENNGTDTLHGGLIGYDARAWSTIKQSASSVTFQLVDPAGFQGFPGEVTTEVTYTLENKSQWKISMHSTATELTPIMLSGHHYWNLEAYEESQDLNSHIVQAEASRWVATNGLLIPTGKLNSVEGTPLDFRKPKSLGLSINATAALGNCGTGCVGFDNAWVYDRPNCGESVFSIWSTNSGIKLDVTTDQIALQIYSCNGIFNPDLPIPRKADQGGPDVFYQDHSCVVIEQESIIDAINNPEFGVNQIYGPHRSYNWESTYAFSVLK
ncbi:galactose mutarotase-like domain-containing protein [Mycena metata]|uniref:Galactose mutarotase-like domain-containing protein n=1 Tax=Mycena metata TaxID=1033252 RepID=A0AAD7K9C6_9AGAR|nr:galactose mutarotase-like domain-containing protein [Mycena metata]